MVTLAAMIVLEGLALVVGEGRYLFDIPDGFRFVGRAKMGQIPALLKHSVLIRKYFDYFFAGLTTSTILILGPRILFAGKT